jgi:bifunctional non-homologous end joining protein LigD
VTDETRNIGGHTLELSNLDKVFFPDANITKGDLVDYYERVAEHALPYAKDRPLSMERYPDGIEAEGFFQKRVPDYFPDWIETIRVKKKDGSNEQVMANNAATLAYLANQGMITPHVGLSRKDRIQRPDRVIFDLDPSDDDFSKVQAAAEAVHELCEELGLKTFVMTSGSRGLHVYIPTDRGLDFDAARETAKALAAVLVERFPNTLTTEQRKNKRGDRVFLDILRNAYGQTTVLPYAVRARPGAPIATPLDWDEALASKMTPTKYTVKNIFQRLAQKSDPWADFGNARQSLQDIGDKLDKLNSDT